MGAIVKGHPETASRRTVRERTDRIRMRLRSIKPEDGDMIQLIGAIKGIIDLIDDIAEGEINR
jgi:hypothetical protein